MEPLKIFIGYDSRWPKVSHVLAYSIKKRVDFPTQIKYLILSDLQKDCLIWRKDLHKGSTEFTYTRFLVPHLCDYKGIALFLDNDMLCLNMTKPIYIYDKKSLGVIKHTQEILSETKMYGCPQIPYERKNWSSFMLMDCSRLKQWTPEYVNETPGLDLHQFKNVPDNEIFELPECFNQLDKLTNSNYGFLHYTSGGPYFKETKNCAHKELWMELYREWLQVIPLSQERYQ